MDIVSSLWADIQLDSALSDMVSGASGQVMKLLPIGIALMFVVKIPSIVRRVINTFI